MKIRKDVSLESDIISLIGMTCTTGALFVWAKETFKRDVEVEENKEIQTEHPTIKTNKYEINI